MSFSAGKNLQTNINTSEAQTLSNKTLDNTNAINGAPVQDSELSNVSITSPEKLQMKQYADLATAQADLANRSGGELVYVADIKKTYQVNDDGLGTKTLAEISGGQGGVNYIENSDFEQGVDGYTDDVNFTIAQTKVANEILRGEASAKLSKAAVDASNEEISVPFTVSRADLAKKLTVSFEYDASDVNYADDDIQVYVKQDPNGTPSVIRINGEDLKGGKGTHYAQFQTDASQTEYELVFKVNSTNASAYSVIIDDVKVGPTNLAKGAIVTDWKAYDAQVANTSSTDTFFYRRVGDQIYIDGNIEFTGAATSTITFQLPEGLNLDTDKLPIGVTGTDSFQVLGDVLARDSSAATYVNGSVIRSSTNTRVMQMNVNGVTPTNAGFTATSPFTWASGDTISVTMSAPIQGWSSNARMSEDLGGREVIFTSQANGTGESLVHNVGKILTSWSTLTDTTNSFNQANGRFTAPESGYYDVSAGTFIVDNNSNLRQALLSIRKNGITVQEFRAGNGLNTGDAMSLYPQVSYNGLYLEKGDYVEIYGYQINGDSATLTVNNVPVRGFFTVAKRSSPQTILESETVAARYTSSNAQGFDRGVHTPIIFENLDYDTHNTYDTETGVYTTAVSGIYSIKANVTFPGGELVDDSGRIQLIIQINGSAVAFREYTINNIGTRQSFDVSSDIQLNKGHLMTITLFHDNGTDPNEINLNPTDYMNYLTIHRIK